MKKTVLVVDDSKSTREFVRLVLVPAGYDVVEAGDGVDALARLASTRVNLVICDVNMPRMDGLTLIGHVRALPSHRFTPIVMLTTESAEALVAQAKAAGAKGWMVKPFKPEQLLGVVQRLVTA